MIRTPTLFLLAASLFLGACHTYYCCDKDREKEREHARQYNGSLGYTPTYSSTGHQVDGPFVDTGGFLGIRPCPPVDDSDRYHADPYPHQPCDQPVNPPYWYP